MFKKNRDRIEKLETQVQRLQNNKDSRETREYEERQRGQYPVTTQSYTAIREGDDLVVYQQSRTGYHSGRELARAKTAKELKKLLAPKLVTIKVCEEL